VVKIADLPTCAPTYAHLQKYLFLVTIILVQPKLQGQWNCAIGEDLSVQVRTMRFNVYLHRTKRKDTETHAHTETHAPDTEKTSQEQEEKDARLFQRLVDDAMKKSRGTLHEGP
jgi:hypothetical protein